MNRPKITVCSFGFVMLILSSTTCFAQQGDDALLQKLKLLLSEQNDLAKISADQSTAFSLGKNEQKVVKPQPEDIIETRLYDLAGLFAIAPPYRARGWLEHENAPIFDLAMNGDSLPMELTGATGGMGGMFNVSDLRIHDDDVFASRPSVASLTRVINDILLRDERGRAEITSIGASLIVRASIPTQEKIERFLKQIEGKWNARATMMIHIHLLWLNSNQSLDLIRTLRNETANGVQSIAYSKLLDWIASHPDDQKALHKSAHAHLYAHNGQTVAWVSGTQKRTVTGWNGSAIRGAKPIPTVDVVMNGITCEVTPMLAAARDKITVDFHGRWVEPDRLVDGKLQRESTEADLPRPDESETTGQSVQSTVRLPVGQVTLVGGGTQWSVSNSDEQLLILLSAEIVSP